MSSYNRRSPPSRIRLISNPAAVNPKKNQRRCVSCRRTGERESFWRIVRVHPGWQIQLNEGMGRSAYLCPREECLRLAQRKNRLARALKARVDEAVYEQLRSELAKIVKPKASATASSESSGGPVDDQREHARKN
ncbi:glr2651 [Gloeobacter violaceus PCC 7421]|uniref:Glr2651 protein n=1 Tax=Gloeobacter violaceus (strain ATCC 29082 / PCC 7421) TaxID=251221 RepID=Q7NH86_GLOVI|nr:glr2651 [Gloeobacter violaceus PCC 7421]